MILYGFCKRSSFISVLHSLLDVLAGAVVRRLPLFFVFGRLGWRVNPCADFAGKLSIRISYGKFYEYDIGRRHFVAGRLVAVSGQGSGEGE